MRLSEGQVMDYTKNTEPYMDDRFAVPAGNNVPTYNQVQADTPARESTLESCIIIQPAPVWNQPAVTPVVAPVQPQLAPIQPHVPVAPFVSPVGPVWPNPLSVGTSDDLYETILDRKKMLESLDTQTSETKTIIKTLDWVLSKITLNSLKGTTGG